MISRECISYKHTHTQEWKKKVLTQKQVTTPLKIHDNF